MILVKSSKLTEITNTRGITRRLEELKIGRKSQNPIRSILLPVIVKKWSRLRLSNVPAKLQWCTLSFVRTSKIQFRYYWNGSTYYYYCSCCYSYYCYCCCCYYYYSSMIFTQLHDFLNAELALFNIVNINEIYWCASRLRGPRSY